MQQNAGKSLKVLSGMAQLADVRRNMIDTQLRTYDVTSKRLLDAIESVDRTLFVPDAMSGLAYLDQPIVLTTGEKETRTLLTPMVLARMIQAAEVVEGERVLDVASGSGYCAAIMAGMGAKLTILEASSALAKLAASSLTHSGLTGIEVKSGALNKGLPKDEAFDIIFINGAIAVEPTALLRQLKDGGRLVTVVGSGRSGRVTVYNRSGDTIGKREVMDAAAPTLSEFKQEIGFRF